MIDAAAPMMELIRLRDRLLLELEWDLDITTRRRWSWRPSLVQVRNRTASCASRLVDDKLRNG